MTRETLTKTPTDDRTRLKVRVAHEDPETGQDTVTWLKHNRSLEEAQSTYIALRERTQLGMRAFGEGEIFDEQGQQIARISYNGRVWDPVPPHPGQTPLLEMPQT